MLDILLEIETAHEYSPATSSTKKTSTLKDVQDMNRLSTSRDTTFKPRCDPNANTVMVHAGNV